VRASQGRRLSTAQTASRDSKITRRDSTSKRPCAKAQVCSTLHKKANNFSDLRLGPRSATPQRWREDCCPGARTDDEMGKWALRFSFGVCVKPSHALLHRCRLDKTGATAAIASTLSGKKRNSTTAVSPADSSPMMKLAERFNHGKRVWERKESLLGIILRQLESVDLLLHIATCPTAPSEDSNDREVTLLNQRKTFPAGVATKKRRA